MRAGFGTAFQNAERMRWRDISSSETADTPHLNARAVYFQRLFQAFFDGAIIASLIHIDEVNNQQPAKSRKRACRATSVAASRLVARAVFSTEYSRVDLPEFTSTATSASVWLITR